MNPPSSALDLLVVATHPDDAEIGAGGTIVRAVRQGLQVGILDLTSGEPTPHGTPERRARETQAATKVLGIAWRENLGLPNRRLEHTLEARRALSGAFRLLRPLVILAPYWEDVHPDHVAASSLVDAARFWAKLSRTDLPGAPFWPPRIYYYWSIHLRLPERPSFVVDISDAIEEKLRAIACYDSQFATERADDAPAALEDIRARARYWGWSIHRAYGEPFASREQIGIEGLTALL